MTGPEFRRRRKELGMTQKAIAEVMHVNTNTVARWERSELAVNAMAILGFENIALQRYRDDLKPDQGRKI